MFKRMLVLAMAAAMSTAVFAQAQRAAAPAQSAMAMAQGTWIMTSAGGQDVTGSGQEILITIQRDTYTQTVNGTVVEKGTFVLDEKKKPMTIDLTILEGDDAGKKQLGVIELTPTTMKGNLGLPGEQTRPTNFDHVDGASFAFAMKKK